LVKITFNYNAFDELGASLQDYYNKFAVQS